MISAVKEIISANDFILCNLINETANTIVDQPKMIRSSLLYIDIVRGLNKNGIIHLNTIAFEAAYTAAVDVALILLLNALNTNFPKKWK